MSLSEHGKPLTRKEVSRIAGSFLVHTHENWDTYCHSLPNLRKTFSVYDTFAMGIRYLPENSRIGIEFNPREFLDENLQVAFEADYSEEVGRLVLGAWVIKRPNKEWEGYKEPIDDTPEALIQEYPTVYETVEQAREAILDPSSSEYTQIDGVRRALTLSGVDNVADIWYRGFTTVEEFQAQTEFLDGIRNHPRISYGVGLWEIEIEKFRQRYLLQEQKLQKIKELIQKLVV